VRRPHVVGHSLGGLIALRLGQAGLARSVTALAPAGFWTEAERRYAYAVLNLVRQGVRLLPDPATTRSAVSPAERSPVERMSRTAALRRRLDFWPWLPESLVADVSALRAAESFKETLRAGRVTGLFTGDIPDLPVTIAWGTRDRILPPWQAARAKTMIPGARLVPLPGCGHVPMADAPELVARVVREATSSTSAPVRFPAAAEAAARLRPGTAT
jgi:pimeloyl-ACP methyl ester carboxylesterase